MGLEERRAAADVPPSTTELPKALTSLFHSNRLDHHKVRMINRQMLPLLSTSQLSVRKVKTRQWLWLARTVGQLLLPYGGEMRVAIPSAMLVVRKFPSNTCRVLKFCRSVLQTPWRPPPSDDEEVSHQA